MNQDQVKELLLSIRDAKETFSLIFSGKTSDKVHGLYKPESREIIIHNRNFTSNDGLIYTAIHEYAHHLQFTQSPVPVSSRSHTGDFWQLFHELLDIAEEKKLYRNIFKTEPEFTALSERIRRDFLTANGELMLQFGKVLSEAHALCEKHRVEFDDYLDRELGMHRSMAKTAIKVSSRDIDPAVGYDNMKLLARIPDPKTMRIAEKALLSGKSPDTVRMEYVARPKSEDRRTNLVNERNRIERTIERLNSRLKSLSREIEELED
ncbi:MAG: hypothetical protein AABZ39_20110 [Spirochaetota bacterium]